MTYICYDDRTVDDNDVDVVVIVVYTCMELIRIYMLYYNTYELSYYWLQYLNGNLVKIKND